MTVKHNTLLIISWIRNLDIIDISKIMFLVYPAAVLKILPYLMLIQDRNTDRLVYYCLLTYTDTLSSVYWSLLFKYSRVQRCYSPLSFSLSLSHTHNLSLPLALSLSISFSIFPLSL